MKLPRDVDGLQLVKALRALGYEASRQTGSHIRVTTLRDGENQKLFPLIFHSKRGRSGAYFNGLPLITT